MQSAILEMENITKIFPGVKALDNVNMDVVEGEIHALVGENCAGKSTLMNVLSGIHPYGTYTGDIIYHGKECHFKTIRDSEHVGIVIIHQELEMVPYLTIAENIFLGNERVKNKIIDWDRTHYEANQLLKRVGLDEDTQKPVMDIGVGKQQLVEIAKVLSKKVKLLILDEPTAALNVEESKKLLKLLLQFKEEGITSIMISHKIHEVSEVADRITILRDGATIETLTKDKDDIGQDRIIKGMVGRPLTNRFPKRVSDVGEVAFEVKNWNVFDPLVEGRKVIKNASINARKGEVVGIAGLMGAGRTEFAMSIFGKAYGKNISGQILINGKEVNLNNVRKAIDNGIAYCTEDRKSAGLILNSDVKSNITLAGLNKISKNSVINENKEIRVAEEYIKKLNIKTSGIMQKAGNLSGGNQQKLILSKWTFVEPDVLVLDEPTRGIDVGAKYEIYLIINELVSEGKSVIFISSELPEIIGMSDRVFVMSKGSIVGELEAGEATQESIMKCIMKSQSKGV
ncbi:MAG: ATP-binding cassette domain-containing protein [Actinobacteria bacterium]|nr:ATP-binding cassette domain-containing protein [Actinomycetota bacterium]